jgi:membrane protein DedA with SNARE-associated domain
MEKMFLRITELSSLSAYLVVFSVLLACGLGFPLPEDVPLIASGYLIWEGTMTWGPALAVTMVGVLLGDTALFYLGRRIGKQILQGNRTQNLFPPDKVRRVRAYFRKYGDKLVFFARFVAGLRAVVFFMAGAMRMKYSRFIWLDGIAAALSVPLWILMGWLLGHFLGSEISRILKSMKDIKTAFTVVVVVVLISFLAHSYRKYRAANKKRSRRRKSKSA